METTPTSEGGRKTGEKIKGVGIHDKDSAVGSSSPPREIQMKREKGKIALQWVPTFQGEEVRSGGSGWRPSWSGTTVFRKRLR